jgi:thiol:disulfide interchange protein
MPIYKKISVALLIISLPLLFVIYSLVWGSGETLAAYPMSVVIKPFYSAKCVLYTFYSMLAIYPILIIGYIIKKPVLSKIMFGVGTLIFICACYISFSEIAYENNAKSNYNPKTVQSTMVEIDLQQMEALQDNEENCMIYFGRPNCVHCEEIKPNLDILINNSHSLVYYYNTEQDRDTNYEAMQAALEKYGVSSVPALVVWASTGETQEICFNEDIVDYFLDTSKFRY